MCSTDLLRNGRPDNESTLPPLKLVPSYRMKGLRTMSIVRAGDHEAWKVAPGVNDVLTPWSQPEMVEPGQVVGKLVPWMIAAG